MLNFKNLTTRDIFFLFVVQALFMNLAWNHSYLSEKMVSVQDYYSFSTFSIFQYRALPSIIYCAVTFGCHSIQTGLNAPVETTYGIFQILWDFLALNIAMVAIKRMFFVDGSLGHSSFAFLCSSLLTVWLFAYSYIFIVNRAVFSPYDFSDFAILLTLASLVFHGREINVWAMVLIMFVGALNKESVLMFPAIYAVLNVRGNNLFKVMSVAAVMGASGLAGKYTAVAFVHYVRTDEIVSYFVEHHLHQNIEQFLNPLFYISVVSICAFLYVPVLFIRKSFDYRDWALLVISFAIFLMLMKIALIRELRLFSPISVIFLIILARHREALWQKVRDLSR